jgi:hypothetical protein
MMPNWSQEDYDERKQRQNDGVASDEDRRLIKLYESSGFTQSRLKEQDAAAARAQDARAAAGAREEGTVVKRPGVNDSKDEWIAYANAVNEGLQPAVRPILDPENAKKDELVAYYKDIETPV